jgi:hypothetical protein
MSLGGLPSDIIDEKVAEAVGSDVVVVVAAGNSNVPACDRSPARVPSGTQCTAAGSSAHARACARARARARAVAVRSFVCATKKKGDCIAGEVAVSWLDFRPLPPPPPIFVPCSNHCNLIGHERHDAVPCVFRGVCGPFCTRCVGGACAGSGVDAQLLAYDAFCAVHWQSWDFSGPAVASVLPEGPWHGPAMAQAGSSACVCFVCTPYGGRGQVWA